MGLISWKANISNEDVLKRLNILISGNLIFLKSKAENYPISVISKDTTVS